MPPLKPLFLGLDVGTQGTKALLYRAADNTVVGRGAAPHAPLLAGRSGAGAEQPPSEWLSACCSATKAALADAGGEVAAAQVRAIGVSGQQHGLVALGARGEVLRDSKLWCDTESAEEAKELSHKWGYETPAAFTASKALWLKRHEPEVFAACERVLLPHNYINWWLSGVYAAEAGDASGVGVFSPGAEAAEYDAHRCADVDARFLQMLPPLVAPNALLGELTFEAREALGLRAAPASVGVAAGSGDNMMSALGAGAAAPGKFVMSLGTSGTLFGASDTAVEDPSGTVAPFRDATGRYLPLLCLQNCTNVLQEVSTSYSMGHDELTSLAAKEPVGCHGVTFLPYLTGERTPNWPHATGCLLGLGPGAMRPGLVYRAAMEGVTFAMRAGFERMQALGVHCDELRLVGGGSKNALWRRIIADTFGLTLRFPAEAESAALGAALQAAAASEGADVGEYVASHAPPLLGEDMQPDPSMRAAYDAAFERHQRLGRQLFAVPR